MSAVKIAIVILDFCMLIVGVLSHKALRLTGIIIIKSDLGRWVWRRENLSCYCKESQPRVELKSTLSKLGLKFSHGVRI
jgi:hypothetical protein